MQRGAKWNVQCLSASLAWTRTKRGTDLTGLGTEPPPTVPIQPLRPQHPRARLYPVTVITATSPPVWGVKKGAPTPVLTQSPNLILQSRECLCPWSTPKWNERRERRKEKDRKKEKGFRLVCCHCQYWLCCVLCPTNITVFGTIYTEWSPIVNSDLFSYSW